MSTVSDNNSQQGMKMDFKGKVAAVSVFGLMTCFGEAVHAEEPKAGQIIKFYNSGKRDVDGPEFRMYVSTKKDGQLRAVDVDADTMLKVELKNGKTVLAPAVAFISNFDLLNAEAMQGLSDANRKLLEKAGKNMSADRSQVAFMLQHIQAAHGVQYAEVKAAAKTCERYFDLNGPK